MSAISRGIPHGTEVTEERAVEQQKGHEWLATQAYSYIDQFYTTSQLEDMDDAIKYLEESIVLLPQGHIEVPTRLCQLGDWLQQRFGRSGELSYLNKAIDQQQHAVSLISEGHPDMPILLNNLGLSLQTRFKRLGNLTDLDKAIEYQQHALSLVPEGHPDMPVWLHNLGLSLRIRFQRLGNLQDLDKAIEHQQHALSLASKEHPGMPNWLDNLGSSLQIRFDRLGNFADLDKAIEHQNHAVSLIPNGHPDMPIWLSNLGGSLQMRFKHLGNLADLDNAMEYRQRAVSLVPEGHPKMPTWLNNLGLSHQMRFERRGGLADLDKAIEHQQHALSLLPKGHPDMSIRHDNLGASLRIRFQRLGNPVDLDKAIEHQQNAVSLAPEGHPTTPVWMYYLGSSFQSRFELLGTDDDLDQSIFFFQKAALFPTGGLRLKLKAALWWAKACAKHQPGSLLDACRQAMVLLPQISWLGSTVHDRYNNILNVGSVCAQAVAAAISMKDYQSALEWFDEGRSIVWKQTLQLRAPVDDLAAIDPVLASELKQVARDLDHAASRGTSDSAVESLDERSLEQTARRHRRLAERWEELVAQARKLPGFQDFLRPRRAFELMRSAHSGNLVILNIYKYRCDALVIRQDGTEISHVPLVNFSLEKAVNISTRWGHLVRSRGSTERAFKRSAHSSNDALGKALAVLWQEVVSPVLEFLGYTKIMPTNNLPHITWCTAGPLSFLPLHAAGNYTAQSMIYDHVISSYTPTLTALLSPNPSPNAFTGILTVGQKSTPGLPPLPGTEAELARIHEQFKGQVVMQLDGDMATPTDVLAGMEKHSWVHFACHAIQNTKSPTLSAFHLHNGTLDLETITQKQLKHADLAFLSACETAMGDENLPDEAVHLAAGMLMAGYRTVIATMWSIGDRDAPLVAEKVYEHLLEGGTPSARRAAVAVHKATEYLRAKVGVKEFAKWAPYIHIGL